MNDKRIEKQKDENRLLNKLGLVIVFCSHFRKKID